MKLFLFFYCFYIVVTVSVRQSPHQGFNKYAVTVNVISVIGGGALRITFHPSGDLLAPKYAKFICNILGPGIGAMTSIGQARMLQKPDGFRDIPQKAAKIKVCMFGPYLELEFYDIFSKFIGSTFSVGVGAGLVGANGVCKIKQYTKKGEERFDWDDATAFDGLEETEGDQEDLEDGVDIRSLSNIDAELERLLNQSAETRMG